MGDGKHKDGPEGSAAGGATLPPQRSGVVALDSPPAARDIRDATLIKEGDLFLLADREGNVPRGNRDGLGLYLRDTRFLSAWELSIQGLRPTILLSEGRSPFLGAQVLTNPNLITLDGRLVHEHTIQIRRYRLIRGMTISESLTFQSFNRLPLTLDVALHLEADFADVFEVRGIAKPARRGAFHLARRRSGSLAFRYDGLDGIRRVTTVRFDSPPLEIRGGTAAYVLHLDPGAAARIVLTISVSESPAERADAPKAAPRRAKLPGYREWMTSPVSIESSNGLFDAIVRQSRQDLRVLLGGEDEETPFIAAGIPWYGALFGRDSLLTALLHLWVSAAPARDTLRLLARFQGRCDEPSRDEEPGKILHELRRGELARTGVVPFSPYYGSVDATPLWIMLLAEYHMATFDIDLVRELLPHVDAALGWIERHGDIDGDGFVEYRSRSALGLVNQGWKDSGDAIMHADGSLAEPPIALVEVQAYVYAAQKGAARLYRAVGDVVRAERQERASARLREAFDAAFWMPEQGYYCLALDGRKRQVKVIASNAGHALLCGIVPPGRAGQVARRLMDEDMYSGFGIRTLSTREVAYNPTGYHVGTVWPHDNALIALGLKRYHEEALAAELITGLYEAAQHFPAYRMPELFCGFARGAFGVPVRYPLACSPQAWAAAAWSAFMQVSLGLWPNAPARELQIVRPRLPLWLRRVEVQRIAVGAGEVDLRYERIGDHTAVDVAAMRGDVRVTFAEAWDPEDP